MQKVYFAGAIAIMTALLGAMLLHTSVSTLREFMLFAVFPFVPTCDTVSIFLRQHVFVLMNPVLTSARPAISRSCNNFAWCNYIYVARALAKLLQGLWDYICTWAHAAFLKSARYVRGITADRGRRETSGVAVSSARL